MIHPIYSDERRLARRIGIKSSGPMSLVEDEGVAESDTSGESLVPEYDLN
ncbi:MAG: hypothetical protein WDO69_15310 [Pseudomonadota bacterium]